MLTRGRGFFPPHIKSKEALIEFHKGELRTFPHINEKVQFMICEKDIVAARIHFTGTQLGRLGTYPPSRKRLNAYYICFFRIPNEKIAEAWVEYDNLNGLVQLGHIEPQNA